MQRKKAKQQPTSAQNAQTAPANIQAPASQTTPVPSTPAKTPSQPLKTLKTGWNRWGPVVIFLAIAIMTLGAIAYLFSLAGVISRIIGYGVALLAGCDFALAPLLLVGPFKTFLRNIFSATEKNYTKWVAISLLIVNIAVFMTVVAATVFTPLIQANIFKSANITGKVFCAGGEQVEGVWIDAQNQGSGFANWYTTNSSGSEAGFKYTLPNGGEYNIHMGCGGSKQNWENVQTTEAGTGMVKDDNNHYFICYDVPLTPDYGQCRMQN